PYSLQTVADFRGWLFRIARNLSTDAFRSRKRLCRLPDDEYIPARLHIAGPQEGLEASEERQNVMQALRKLAESHQTVLILRELEGLSYAEIARRLDISQSAVETLLFRAR